MQLVETSAALTEVAASLTSTRRVYLDTEFESTRQGTRLCLVQLTAGEEVFVIDALRLPDLTALRDALGRDECEWVLHAGAQDVKLLIESLRLAAPPRLFDTQVAWALTGPEYSVSLAYLLYRTLGLRSAKSHQADDWKRRPLPRAQLEYAAADVEYLPRVYEVLVQRARDLGREDVIDAASRELLWPAAEPPSKLELASFRNAWQLDPHSQAGLSFLIEWYNSMDEGQRQHAPEAKVLLSIAKRMPESAMDLERIKGVPRQFARRHGDGLTAELMRRSATAGAESFVPIDPPPYATLEEIWLDAWLGAVRAESCVRARIAPELAFPGRLLRHWRHAILEQRSAQPLLDGLSGWRRDVLLPHLAAAVAAFPLKLDV